MSRESRIRITVQHMLSIRQQTLGYTQNTSLYHTYADVIAYGKSNHIEHFAKVVTWDSAGSPTMIESKWGGLEVLKSTSINPFYESGYGHPMEYYNAP